MNTLNGMTAETVYSYINIERAKNGEYRSNRIQDNFSKLLTTNLKIFNNGFYETNDITQIESNMPAADRTFSNNMKNQNAPTISKEASEEERNKYTVFIMTNLPFMHYSLPPNTCYDSRIQIPGFMTSLRQFAAKNKTHVYNTNKITKEFIMSPNVSSIPKLPFPNQYKINENPLNKFVDFMLSKDSFINIYKDLIDSVNKIDLSVELTNDSLIETYSKYMKNLPILSPFELKHLIISKQKTNKLEMDDVILAFVIVFDEFNLILKTNIGVEQIQKINTIIKDFIEEKIARS